MCKSNVTKFDDFPVFRTLENKGCGNCYKYKCLKYIDNAHLS